MSNKYLHRFVALSLAMALALGVAPATPAYALTETGIATGAADSGPEAIDLKQAIDDFVANAGQSVSAAEKVGMSSITPMGVHLPIILKNH
jgi:hypothetical protein